MSNILTKEDWVEIEDFLSLNTENGKTDHMVASTIAHVLFQYGADETDFEGYRWLRHAWVLSEANSKLSDYRKFKIRSEFQRIQESMEDQIDEWEDMKRILPLAYDEDGMVKEGSSYGVPVIPAPWLFK